MADVGWVTSLPPAKPTVYQDTYNSNYFLCARNVAALVWLQRTRPLLILGAADLAAVTEKSRRRPRYRHHTEIVARERLYCL